jgi:hypothetical protein
MYTANWVRSCFVLLEKKPVNDVHHRNLHSGCESFNKPQPSRELDTSTQHLAPLYACPARRSTPPHLDREPPYAPALSLILARLRSPDLVFRALLCRTHPRSIDSRFVSAVRPDDSAVTPSAPSAWPLQEGTEGGRGESASGHRGGLGGAGRTVRDSAGGIGGNRAPAALGQRAACARCSANPGTQGSFEQLRGYATRLGVLK